MRKLRLRWLNKLYHIKNKFRFATDNKSNRPVKMKKTIVLLIGPESTATRAFTESFSSHTRILGTKEARGHHDVLDPVWQEIEKGNMDRALKAFPKTEGYDLIVTRRSVPHSQEPGLPAQFMSTPNLDLFQEVCDAIGIRLFVLVTSRSPIPNLVSWKMERASAGQSFERAYRQYMNAYRSIFSFIARNNLEFLVVSLESFVLDGEELIKSLYKFLGLSTEVVNLKSSVNPNKKRYQEYWKWGDKGD